MAAISTIRKHYGIVVALIGFAIAAFVISDALNLESGVMFRDSDNVGVVAGEEISRGVFDQRSQQYRDNYMAQTEQRRLDAETIFQINHSVWESFVNEIIMSAEYEALGIQVTSEEANDMVVGENPHPSIRQQFTDPETGRYDPNHVANFLDQMQGDQRRAWLNFERDLIRDRKNQKYNALVSKSVFVTDIEAKNDHQNSNRRVTSRIAGVNINRVSDDEVSFTDRELRNFYNENKHKYKQEASRSIDYVLWEVQPTAEDTQIIVDRMERIKEDFKIARNDSIFVRVNSEVREPIATYPISELSESLQNNILDMDSNDVYGPYKDGNYYIVSKLLGIVEDTVNYYHKARHILINIDMIDEDDAESAAAAKANELLSKIRRGEADFADLAAEHNTDATAQTGGDLGWFADGTMVDAFDEAIRRASKGDVFVVETEFGAHVVEKTENSHNLMFKMGHIFGEIYPSSKTFERGHRQAYEFYRGLRTADEFYARIEEMELNKQSAEQIGKDDRSFGRLSNAREVVRWAYESNLHDISGIVEVDDRYMVAIISNVAEEGVAPLEDVRSRVEVELRNKKKKEMLAEQFNEVLQTANSISEVAGQMETEIRSVADITFNSSSVSEFGNDPHLIGAMLGSPEGVLSGPIKGVSHVYVIENQQFFEEEMQEPLIAQKREDLLSRYRGMTTQRTQSSLKDMAEIQDRRYRYY